MRVAVIGAGPAGMTAALQLCRGGAQVTVYEGTEHTGGMARSFELWGQRVDLGPHRFFSSDRRVNQLWLEMVREQFTTVQRQTRIYYQGQFFHYPLKPLHTLYNLGILDAAKCLASYLRAQVRPSYPAGTIPSFETWVVSAFGRRLYEIFFQSYSEKLWGIPCSQLSADFATQRIKEFSLREAILSSVWPKRGRRHQTLLDRFAYPFAGSGSVYETMADLIRDSGGHVRLQCPVKRIVHEGYEVRGVELESEREESFDQIVSTMPLTTLVRGLNDVPSNVQSAVEKLQFRNTILIYLHVDSESLFDDQWLYIHSPDLKIGRVTNFRNWSPQLYGDQRTTILAVELWCNSDDDDWTLPDEQLVKLGVRELRTTGLLQGESVLDGHVIRVPRCYPVYRQGYQDHVKPIIEYLQMFPGLTPIGRYGAFKYVNQDHSILMGILAAEKILNRQEHDLWNIGADQEEYQEAALIAETGLANDMD